MPRRFRVRRGNCLKLMRKMPEASVDAIVTDPPYGLEFMGKAWDTFTGAGMSKPGIGERSTAWPSFVGSNTIRCGKCGLLVGHGGSPCPCKTPKPVSMRGGRMRAFQAWCTEWAREALRVAKPGAHLLAFGGTRTFHRLACAIEDAGWEIRDCLSWLYGSGFPKSHNGPWGGTALKPAWEPIIVARKPLIGTVAANVAAHGTGALNIDGCRVVTDEPLGGGAYTERSSVSGSLNPSGMNVVGAKAHGEFVQPEGRWPANVALDETAARLLDEQSGERKGSPAQWSRGNAPQFSGRVYTKARGQEAMQGFGDTGGAARFFYCAKASRSEREAGLDEFRETTQAERTGREPGSAGLHTTVRPNVEGGNPYANGGSGRRRNTHPTVKPVNLMRWLVRLVTPPGGRVLDPFAGSGTTGIAAVLEGFRFLGHERERAYVKIARARIRHALPPLSEPDEPPPP